MGQVETIPLVPSIDAGASSCTPFSPELHQIFATLRTVHRAGAAKWLQRVTGRAPRTVKYWLAGKYAPKGKDAIRISRALRAELDAHSATLRQFELDLG